MIAVDPALYRPTEVTDLLGDPTKSIEKLGWDPQRTSYEELIKKMAEHDRALVRREK